MTDPFQHLVASRSWEWLTELCRPLGLEAVLVDRNGSPAVPGPSRNRAQPSHVSAPDLRRLGPAIDTALNTQTPQIAQVGPQILTITPIRGNGGAVGALVLTPRVAGHPSHTRDVLAALSGWLRGAVERHLGSHAVGAEHLAALSRTLQSVAADASDRRLVSVFAEALAVWHDIDVVGYVEASPGVFTRAVCLAGHQASDPPLVFPPETVPSTTQGLVRMPHTHVEAGDRSATSDALVSTLTRSGDSAWLLTFAGGIDACEPALLSGYVSALDLAIATMSRAASARLALAVWADLTADTREPQRGLQRAMERVQKALSVDAADCYLQGLDGTVDLAAHGGRATPDADRAQRLVVQRRPPQGLSLTLELEHTTRMGWTPVEHLQANAVADVIESWFARQPIPAQPQLPVPVPVDDAAELRIKASVEAALTEGRAVTLGLFSCSRRPGPDVVAAIETDARRHLRSGDSAVMLPTGEVAVVLFDLPSSQAPIALQRLRVALSAAAQRAGLSITADGFASRMPGQDQAADILSDARQTRASR